MKSKTPKVLWLPDQDALLTVLVKKYGTRKWSHMADQLWENYGGVRKSGKQCRERWYNHLDPSIVKREWTREEEDIMFEEHRKYGNKWTLLVEKLVGRSDNAIKNHFYSTIRKSLRRITKFLGSKDGTAKVRKIKPATLSKIFQTISEDSPSQSHSPSSHSDPKSREIAYHLINFSRWKLLDSKRRVAQEDVEKLGRLLEDVQRLCEREEREERGESGIKMEVMIPDKHQGQRQGHLGWLQLNNPKHPAFLRPSQPHSQSLTPSSNSVFKAVQTETVAQIHPQIFNFCLQLEQQNYPQINPISASPWLRITPYIITPPIANQYVKKLVGVGEAFGAEDCDLLAERIRETVKRNGEGSRGMDKEEEKEEEDEREGEEEGGCMELDVEMDAM